MNNKPETNKRNRKRHKFLLTFFSPEEHYQVQEVNGWVLVKYHNNGNNEWEVAIYDKYEWEKVKEWKEQQRILG